MYVNDTVIIDISAHSDHEHSYTGAAFVCCRTLAFCGSAEVNISENQGHSWDVVQGREIR